MSTVLPREEAVETIFSKILASPEASGRLSGVFYDHIDDDHRLTDNDRDHFLQVLFHAYLPSSVIFLLPAIPLARTRAVSLVDVSPSTDIMLNESSTIALVIF